MILLAPRPRPPSSHDNDADGVITTAIMDVTRAISSTISGTSFSFLSSAEIRAMSVKQISNPVLLDNTQNPTAGGLYDPMLGPMKKDDICQACHLNHFQCPGHFGHIELPQPVFHPLFMTHMYNLLRGSCLYCHRFKIPEFQVSKSVRVCIDLYNNPLTLILSLALIAHTLRRPSPPSRLRTGSRGRRH